MTPKQYWMEIMVAIGVFGAVVAVLKAMYKKSHAEHPAAAPESDAAKALPPATDTPAPADTTAQVVVATVVSPSMPPKADRPLVLPPRERLLLDEKAREETGLCTHCERDATHGIPCPEPATRRRVGDDITLLWRVRPRSRPRVQLTHGNFWDELHDWYAGVDSDALLCAEHYATALMHANRRVHELNASASRFLTEQNDDAREFQMHVRELMRDETNRVKHGRPKGAS